MGQHCEAFQPYPFSSSFFSFFRKPKMNLLISISTLCFVSLVAGIPAKAYDGAKDFDRAEEMDEANRQKDGGGLIRHRDIHRLVSSMPKKPGEEKKTEAKKHATKKSDGGGNAMVDDSGDA